MKIEKNIPIPRIKRQGPSAILNRMEPGDSVLIFDYSKVTLLLTTGKRVGFTVTSRKQEEGGWRVWLVSKSPKSSVKTTINQKETNETLPLFNPDAAGAVRLPVAWLQTNQPGR